jgi:hypothetical protein
VEDEIWNNFATAQGLLERGANQLSAHVVGEGSTDDLARTEVDDDCQIDPASSGRNEGDIAGPDLIGFLATLRNTRKGNQTK